MTGPRPAGAATLRAILGAALPPGPLGVAVSGGGDSMALLRLLAGSGRPLRAATVDHALRDASAAEAAMVALACAGMAVPHDTLVWRHGAVRGNLQDAARRARRALLGDWALRHGIAAIALGHTADDQAETVLMGLARGAGVDGLAGMRARWTEGGVTFHRPLLAVARADLRAFLSAEGQDWAEDPSNDDDRFARTRARRALAALAPLGIGTAALGRVAANLAEARDALDAAAGRAFARMGRAEAGAVLLDRAGLAGLPAETARRILSGALRWVAGGAHAPRGPATGRVLEAVRAGRDATLAGCRIRARDATAIIAREPRAVAGLVAATHAPWDGRWRLAGPHAPDLHLAALGAAGLRACPDWRATGLPRDVLAVTPAVWRGGSLVAAPLAGRPEGWAATLAAGFGLPPLSH